MVVSSSPAIWSEPAVTTSSVPMLLARPEVDHVASPRALLRLPVDLDRRRHGRQDELERIERRRDVELTVLNRSVLHGHS